VLHIVGKHFHSLVILASCPRRTPCLAVSLSTSVVEDGSRSAAMYTTNGPTDLYQSSKNIAGLCRHVPRVGHISPKACCAMILVYVLPACVASRHSSRKLYLRDIHFRQYSHQENKDSRDHAPHGGRSFWRGYLGEGAWKWNAPENPTNEAFRWKPLRIGQEAAKIS